MRGAPGSWSRGVRAPGSAQRAPLRTGGCNFPRAQVPRRVPARRLPRSEAPPPRRQFRRPSPRAQGLSRTPVTRPLPSGPLLGGSAFLAGSEGPMEQAAGPLRNAFSGRVLERKAPGAPPGCSVPGCGPRAEPQAPLGDRAKVPHPAPEPPLCPWGAFLPATYHPEERRALRVHPEPASSALAAPGQPRDSARWMLCVAEAKLKVSGMWARSSESAGGSL